MLLKIWRYVEFSVIKCTLFWMYNQNWRIRTCVLDDCWLNFRLFIYLCMGSIILALASSLPNKSLWKFLFSPWFVRIRIRIRGSFFKCSHFNCWKLYLSENQVRLKLKLWGRNTIREFQLLKGRYIFSNIPFCIYVWVV